MVTDRVRLQLILLFAEVVFSATPTRTGAASPGAVSVSSPPSACAVDYRAVGSNVANVARDSARVQTRYQEQIWGLADAGEASKARALQNSLEKAMKSTRITVLRKFGESESAGAAEEVVIGSNMRGIMKAKAGDQGDPKVEVAAYLIDKHLEQDSVPVTILRIHEGREVSVQASVTDANLLTESKSIRDRVQKENPPELQFFDHLIANYDRTGGNYFVQGQRLIAIDNGAGFVARTSTYIDSLKAAVRLPPDAAISTLRGLVPKREVFEKLEATSESNWRTILGPYLSAEQLQMFLTSRNEAIDAIRSAQRQFGDGIFK